MAVSLVLKNGAKFVGRTVMDELAFGHVTVYICFLFFCLKFLCIGVHALSKVLGSYSWQYPVVIVDLLELRLLFAINVVSS